MIVSRFSRCALIASLAAGLGACSAAQTQRVTPGMTQPGAAHAALPPHGHSWMAPGTQHDNLLYIADPGDGFIRVYELSRGPLAGLLYQSNEPNGMCVDKANDVFVPGFNGGYVVEYAHGLAKPKAKLTPAGLHSMSCSVDQSTGNLAVTTFEGNDGMPGNVAIYAQAQGSPTTYSDPAIFEYFFCGYDAGGNLFVDGLAPRSAGGPSKFVLDELPKGSTTFTNITLNQTINRPGQVQWDGTDLAIGDPTTTNIYRFAISGLTGTLQGTTSLEGATTVDDFTIRGPDVIVANAYTVGSVDWTDALFYPYPAGGAIHRVSGKDKYTIEGVGVSLAR